MRLVVDTSALVGDMLRAAGRVRLRDERLDLFLPEQMAAETEVELPRRIAALARHRKLDDAAVAALTNQCFDALRSNVAPIGELVYAAAEDEARARCLRDPHDWPVVATALALGGDIWTNDNDFLGVGVATWTTDTLQGWIERSPR